MAQADSKHSKPIGRHQQFAVKGAAAERFTMPTKEKMPELWTIQEAAKLLRIAPRTIDNWISARKFGSADGLVYIGGRKRILIRTLQKRVARGGVAGGSGRHKRLKRSTYMDKAVKGFAASTETANRRVSPSPAASSARMDDGVFDFTQAP